MSLVPTTFPESHLKRGATFSADSVCHVDTLVSISAIPMVYTKQSIAQNLATELKRVVTITVRTSAAVLVTCFAMS